MGRRGSQAGENSDFRADSRPWSKALTGQQRQSQPERSCLDPRDELGPINLLAFRRCDTQLQPVARSMQQRFNALSKIRIETVQPLCELNSKAFKDRMRLNRVSPSASAFTVNPHKFDCPPEASFFNINAFSNRLTA